MEIDKNDDPASIRFWEAAFFVTWSKRDLKHGIVAEL